MCAIKPLPANYHLAKTLNLSSLKAGLWLNLAAIPLLFFYGWIFTYLINTLRASNSLSGGIFRSIASFRGWELLTLLLAVVIMLLMHELIHGLFFWFFTHDRPSFALKSGYAFAAAPEWYLPGMQYILVGIAPFIGISTICLLAAWVSAPSLIPYLLMIATFNAAGSLGDLIVVSWVLLHPNNALIRDAGDVFYAYIPNPQ